MHWKITHCVGTCVIFASAILLIVATITAPVIHKYAIFKVNVPQDSPAQGSPAHNGSIVFGSFGYCIQDLLVNGTPQNNCTTAIGYTPSEALGNVKVNMTESTRTYSTLLTKGLLLHPVACVVALLALGLDISHNSVGGLVGFIVTFLACALTLAVMVINFSLLGLIHGAVRDSDQHELLNVEIGVGAVSTLIAFILLGIGTFIVPLTCCARRREHKTKGKGRKR